MFGGAEPPTFARAHLVALSQNGYGTALRPALSRQLRAFGMANADAQEIKQGMEALCPRNETESFLRDNYRLACQAVVQNPDIDVVFSPLRRTPKILTLTQEKSIELDPLSPARATQFTMTETK